MIRVQVESVEIQTKNGTSQRTGKPYAIREQEAWGYFCGPDGKPHPHPQKMRITLGDQDQPYPVGTYIIAPESLYPDRYGQVTCRVRLRPVAAPAAAAAPRSAA